jgi:hypothetical protein
MMLVVSTWRNACVITEYMSEFEDTKGEVRIRISKNIQHNGQKKKVQTDREPSTNHTHKTKDRVTRTQLKTGGEFRCSGRVGSFCSISDTRHVNLVTNAVISHEWGKDREVLTIRGTYPWSFVTQIFHSDQSNHGGSLGSVASLLPASRYQGNPDRNHQVWNNKP